MDDTQIIARVSATPARRVIGVGTLDELKKIDHPFIEQFFERRPDEDGGDSTDYHQSLTGNSE